MVGKSRGNKQIEYANKSSLSCCFRVALQVAPQLTITITYIFFTLISYMLKNHLQYWLQLCNLSSFVHYHKWYSVEFMLHSRGRVMNDSTLRIRIARFGPSFSLCSLCITVAAQEGASGQSAVSALPVSLLLCCNLFFVVKPLLLFVWAEANFLLCLASLHLRSLMKIHLRKSTPDSDKGPGLTSLLNSIASSCHGDSPSTGRTQP